MRHLLTKKCFSESSTETMYQNGGQKSTEVFHCERISYRISSEGCIQPTEMQIVAIKFLKMSRSSNDSWTEKVCLSIGEFLHYNFLFQKEMQSLGINLMPTCRVVEAVVSRKTSHKLPKSLEAIYWYWILDISKFSRHSQSWFPVW